MAYLGDTDSEDELPEGWEERVRESDGRVYFACHETQLTQWTHPITGKRKVVPQKLPYGWERRLNNSGVEIFYEVNSGKETLTDPRLAFSKEPKESLFDFKQKYDGSSTGAHILKGMDLSGKTALITGANSGIGFETAKNLSVHGADVILACRSVEKGLYSEIEIKKLRPLSNSKFIHLDLSSFKSVQNFANEVLLKYKRIDILVLNAGIFGTGFKLTENNFEQMFQVNYLAQIYLTLLLKPVLGHGSRVIFISSESHRFSLLSPLNLSWDYVSPPTSKTFSSFLSYNTSKLLLVLASVQLSMIWKNEGISANSLHPGNLINTGLSRNWWVYRLIFTLVSPFTKSIEQGVGTTIWAAVSDDLEGVTGLYLNNCWISSPSQLTNDVEFRNRVWDLTLDMMTKIDAHLKI